MVSHIYANLPRNAIVWLLHFQRVDIQSQETFLRSTADKWNFNYDTEYSNRRLHKKNQPTNPSNYGDKSKNIILHCSTNDKNADWDSETIVERIIKLVKSIKKYEESNVTFSRVVARHSK